MGKSDFLEEQLESLVDSFGITAVLNHLQGVCDDKAAVLAHDLHDQRVADHWRRVSGGLQRAIERSYESKL